MVKANLIPEYDELDDESDQGMDHEEETDHEENLLDHDDLSEMRIEEGVDVVAELGTLTPPDTPVRDDSLADGTSLTLGIM